MSEPGELLIRGPQVMQGYLGNAEATAAMLDADGWLHTGDIATVTSDGIYRIVDRAKELIKYKGYQVAPAVLEAVLLRHPLIADAAVIGVLDEDGQEIPKAFVVLQPGALLVDEAVMAYVADEVAPHEKVARGGVRRDDPEVELGQDPAEGPSRSGAGAGLSRGVHAGPADDAGRSGGRRGAPRTDDAGRALTRPKHAGRCREINNS